MKTSKKNHLYKAIIALIVFFHSFGVHSQIWNPLPTNITNDLKACCFIDANTGWVAGDSGTVIKTIDGGSSWSTHAITNTTTTLRTIFFINSMVGWAAGDSGKVIKTLDGGASWTLQTSGLTAQQIYAIEFADLNTGWLTAQNGIIRRTTNGGASWGPQLSGVGGNSIWGLDVLDNTHAWASSAQHNLISTITGTSWTPLTLSVGGPLVQNNDVEFVDLNHGWTTNTAGNILHTIIGGFQDTAWYLQPSGTSNDLLSIDMVDINKGWVSGRQGTILSTINGNDILGNPVWHAEASGTTTPLWQIDFVNDTTGWAVGGDGLVIKYQHIIPIAPVTILQPNGGEIYQSGTTQSIIWLADPTVTCISLLYSIDNGANWIPISGATNLTTPPNSFPWVVPNTSSLQALIRIIDCTNPANADTSDAIFYIQPVPQGDDYSVLLTANSSSGPDQITINWQADLNALTYDIYRKQKTDSLWTFLSTVPVSANSYTDFAVNVGEAWEYKVKKTTPQLTGYGYIYAGLELPETDFRGDILLLIDTNYATFLSPEIDQMELDLIGDGYKVIKKIIHPSIGAQGVKNAILQEYTNGDSLLTSVLSIGHLPAAYSGNFAPDGHAERIGAQPTDGFYGDMDGVWTDNTIITSNSGPIHTPNSIGDGRFDHNIYPSAIELQVGRIDLHNMTGFLLSEANLLQQYLDKDHDFRLKNMNPSYRGLLNSTMDHTLPNTSAAAWRSFTPMFGTAIKEMNTNYAGVTEFLDSITNGSYLWTHMAGGGSDTSMTNDVFTSTGCINNPINTVFMQMYGSYFVEWYKGSSDTTNNLLRAPLASNGSTLATVWSGRAPFWHFHHMALGETFGYSTVTNQNNYSTYDASSNTLRKGIHMSMMGDPTLKMHIVAPVSNLNILSGGVAVDLNWTASTDNNIVGYNIYRADSLRGTFSKINNSYVTSTNYNDPSPLAGNSVYMVRAVKLEVRPSGSYYNLSTGMIDSAFTTLGNPSPAEQSFTIYPNPARNVLNFSQELENAEIYNIYGQLVMATTLNAKSISVENLANGIYFIRSGNINKKFIVKH